MPIPIPVYGKKQEKDFSIIELMVISLIVYFILFTITKMYTLNKPKLQTPYEQHNK